MMTFDLSGNVAVWLVNTTKYIARGFATGGVGLPAAVAYSAKEYYTDVRNVTPPSNGGSVASVALNKGKAAITIDLHNSFRVVQKVTGKQLSAPFEWYLNRPKFRGKARVKFNVTLSQFKDIEKKLQTRVGYMQSGWNGVLRHFNAAIPGWVSNKNGIGSFIVRKAFDRMIIKAENKVRSIKDIDDMQRRIDYVSKKAKKKLEAASNKVAKSELGKIFRR